ncbi:MAG: ATP-dependent Clp protease proteolytic subunit [Kiritimatiellae bacterium]|nr:ATP-dependent Clp protease proteolytic subunit [Kiritimatiellia bacterium]
MKTFKLDADIGYKTGDTWYGRQIGPDSISEFLADCAPGERVKIEINSTGGYVVPGLAIANSIKNSKAHVVAHVVGLAASMASVVMCACDEIQLEEGSFVMIHHPWGWAEGDADAMRKEAEVLDTMKAAIMAFYRGKFADKSDDEISAMMDEETWYTGTDALRAGLKCVVIPTTVQAAASATFHHRFAKVPDGAKKFFAMKEKPEDKPNSPEKGESATSADSPTPDTAAHAESQPADAGEQKLAPPPSEVPAQDPAPVDWAARLAGLQAAKDKELAEMSAKYKADLAAIKDRQAESLAAVQAQMDEIISAKNQISAQLEERTQELAKAQAEVSSLTQRLADSEKALAQTREQLDGEIAQHRKLASAALQQPGEKTKAGMDLIRCKFS